MHLASSTGCAERSCTELHGLSGEGELSFLVHSISDDCCWTTGGADGPPPWSWGLSSSCLAFSRGCCDAAEETFKDLRRLDSELAESWEPMACLVWAAWMRSSEKRTFFSEFWVSEGPVFPWAGDSSPRLVADTGAADPLTSSDVLSDSGLSDTFIFECRSFTSSTSASVRASSSSRNSSNVDSEL